MGCRLSIHLQIDPERAGAEQGRCASCDESEQSFHVVRPADTRDVLQVACEKRGHVRIEETGSAARVAVVRTRETAGDHTVGVGATPDIGGVDPRWIGGEETIDECLPARLDLSLRERPQPDVVNAPRQQVGDCRQREQVGGPREQELSRSVV